MIDSTIVSMMGNVLISYELTHYRTPILAHGCAVSEGWRGVGLRASGAVAPAGAAAPALAIARTALRDARSWMQDAAKIAAILQTCNPAILQSSMFNYR